MRWPRNIDTPRTWSLGNSGSRDHPEASNCSGAGVGGGIKPLDLNRPCCDVDLRFSGFSAAKIQFEFAAVPKAVLGN